MIDRPEAGIRFGSPPIEGPFRAFYEHFGPTLCGEALTEVLLENGVPTQYFRNLALEERIPGQVSLKSLGARWLALRPPGSGGGGATTEPPTSLEIVEMAEELPRHADRRYERRPLSEIRYLVVHHSGASPGLGPRAIAEEHVARNGWPGIGYHFVIDAEGTVFRTQDMGLSSFHVAQFNPVSLGIALTGDFRADPPLPAQLDALARLCRRLLDELGLPESALRGHGEMVRSDCPGPGYLSGWRPQLVEAIRRLAGAEEAAQAQAAPTAVESQGMDA